MKIKRLVIENFKSIERIELVEPNPFTVFVGPNGSGKSNIFEALEYVNLSSKTTSNEVDELFSGSEIFLKRNLPINDKRIEFRCNFDSFDCYFKKAYSPHTVNAFRERGWDTIGLSDNSGENYYYMQSGESTFIRSKNFHIASSSGKDAINQNSSKLSDYLHFFERFSRLFISNKKYEKLVRDSSLRLTLSANNLEKVLRRLLNNSIINEEFGDWLSLFLPGFSKIEVNTDELTGNDTLLFYEENSEKPYTKSLISDGTYNIIALLTAIYQSNEPQFLCIEEPENGLHPQVLMTLVDLIRQQCEKKGHYIWLNTHSESLVRMLTPKEIILVDKREGATQIKQVHDRNLYDIPTDEAWLTGALGGGLPW